MIHSLCNHLIDSCLKEAADKFKADLDSHDYTCELELILCSDEYIREVNKEYRSIDKVTDVLSFPMQNMFNGELTDSFSNIIPISFMGLDTKSLSLGTIVISIDRLREQAKEYNHSSLRELAFLLTHSILHLLGYDHMKDDERLAMEGLQDSILEEVGINRNISFDDRPDFLKNLEDYYVLLDKRELDINSLTEDEYDEFIIQDSDNLPILDSDEDLKRFQEIEEIQEIEDDDSLIPKLRNDKIDKMSVENNFKFAYVGILGRPNVGKSSLLNTLVGQNLAIISHKAQTTRRNIKAIINRPNSQLVITDTPGMNKADTKLGRFMEKSLRAALDYSDLILFMVDATHSQAADIEKRIIKLLKEEDKKVILLVNKIDKISKEVLFPLITNYSQLYDFAEIVPISVKKSDGIELLLDLIEKHIPYGEPEYSEDSFTDQSERSICAELIREQILIYTHKEIPHGTAVAIEKFEELDRNNIPTNNFEDRTLVKITAVILCEKSSHKGIIIGKNSSSIKRIVSSARLKMEELLDCKVYLDCHIKIKENWKNKDQFLKEFGYGIEDDNLMREIL